MGAGNSTMSTAINDIINRTVNNISTDIKSSCIIDNTNRQNVDINLSKITGCGLNITGINQNINATSTMDCKNANIDQTTLMNTLTNNLEAGAKTVKDSPFFSFGDQASATAINKALNEVTNNVNVSKIAESIMKSLNDQNIAINIQEWKCVPHKDKKGNIIGTELNIGDINQDILNNVVLNALTENQSVVDAATTIDNTMKANASATSLGLSAAMLALLVPLIIIFLIFGIFGALKGQGSKGSSDTKKLDVNIKGSFGNIQSNTKTIRALFYIFLISAMIICTVMYIQIGKLTKVSESMYLYYGLMVVYLIVALATCGMFIFYMRSNNNTVFWLIISGAIITAVIGLIVLVLTGIEINDIETQIKDYTTNPEQY